MQLPQSALTCSGARAKMQMFVLLTFLADLAIAGSQAGLRLTFPVAYLGDGRQIAAALIASAA